MERAIQHLTRRAITLAGLAASVMPAHAQTAPTVVAYGDDPRQRIALYGPFGEARPAPILMWLPGGGWRSHSITDAYDLPSFARRHGLLLAVCDYRAIPGHGARHMAQDAAACVSWLKWNAAAHGGDPDRLFVMGHSAGGHLAALINCDASYLNEEALSPADLRGVILLDGACYDAAQQRAFLQAHSRTADFFEVLFGGRMEDYTPADQVEIGTPSAPMLMLYASGRPYAQAQNAALARALDAAQRPYRLLPDRNTTHVSMVQDFGRHGDRNGRVTAEFIRTGEL